MATYYCDYVGDDGRTYSRIEFQVYRVSITVGTRGDRLTTTPEEDARLLPEVLFDYLEPTQPRLKYCSLPFIYRNALLWTSRNSYIHCPVPWEPNSSQFNTFFNLTDLQNNANFLSVGLNGERIESSYLNFLVNNG